MSVHSTFKNRLSVESSPYLKQHESNPVDWHPWGAEALAMARTANKPIFLSIGYSSCHWCHVMAHESFEDVETAKLMNEMFINIKVDREERPDIDDIYMEAVQVMTRHGGWPLSVFLTPDLKPFYGGTYFPPEARHGQPSFKDVLNGVSNFYENQRADLESRADELIAMLKEAPKSLSLKDLEVHLQDTSLTTDKIASHLFPKYTQLLDELDRDADKVNGGFGRAPKFPQPSKIAALLFSERKTDRAQALLTLDKIRCGGIADQIGGGISRYSVDSVWLVPHFEKMLYDNAQLLPLFAAASKVLAPVASSLPQALGDTAQDIFSYLERDLKCKETGLYYSAEDADSEGEEGKFYSFYCDEFDEIFSADLELKNFAKKYYKVTTGGNFEGANILTCPSDFSTFCHHFGISLAEGQQRLQSVRQKILAFRDSRVRPGLDNKILLSWNALAATGLLQAAKFSSEPRYFARGLELVQNLLKNFKEGEKYFHCLTFGEKKIGAFCDDLAFLLEAMSEAILLTGQVALVKDFLHIAKTILAQFSDPSTGSLYFAPAGSDLLIRPHRPEDNVIYSAHSAILGATQAVLSWAGASQQSELFSKGDLKMLEALSLLAVSNVARLAENAPLACANSLQKVSWLNTRTTILVERSGPGSGSIGSIGALFQALLAQGKANVIVAHMPNEVYSLEQLSRYAEPVPDSPVKYALCNNSGCQLPTSDTEEVGKLL